MGGKEVLLVIPCYRHGSLLAKYLRQLGPVLENLEHSTRLVLVDDGSPIEEQEELANTVEELRTQFPFMDPLVASRQNSGKGYAIRSGWDLLADEEWLAFLDADGAIPAEEVGVMIKALEGLNQPTVLAAVRAGEPSKEVRRSWFRFVGSWAFNLWVRFHLKTDLDDTQCGLKVIPRGMHEQQDWQENGFVLDLEILQRAQRSGIPVKAISISWQEIPGSSLRLRNTLRIFGDVRRLAKRGKD